MLLNKNINLKYIIKKLLNKNIRLFQIKAKLN